MKVLRQAQLSDLASIALLFEQTAITWGVDAIKDCFNAPYKIWVLDDGDICAAVVVTCITDIWEIIQLAVSPAHQSKGVGSQMLSHVIDQASFSGVAKLQLEVRVSNTPAISLYQKYGFAQVGCRKAYYSNQEDALLFDLTLPNPVAQ